MAVPVALPLQRTCDLAPPLAGAVLASATPSARCQGFSASGFTRGVCLILPCILQSDLTWMMSFSTEGRPGQMHVMSPRPR